MSINEREFNKRGFLDKISDYKLSIFFITIAFMMLAFLYIFSTQKMYKTDATLEIVSRHDLINSKFARETGDMYDRYFETQMEFLQSRYLVSKVIDKLELNINYYEKDDFSKYRVLQKEEPFFVRDVVIKDDNFYKKLFHVKKIDDKHFLLSLVDSSGFIPKLSQKKEILKADIYQFSKPISTDYFDFMVDKNSFLDGDEIYFKVIPKREYVNRVLKNLKVVRGSLKSSIIKIVYEDTTPVVAQKFVNTLIDEYMSVARKQQKSQSENHLLLIDSEIEVAKRDLDYIENTLQKFIEEHRVIGLGAQTNNLIEAMYSYEKRLEDAEIFHQNLERIYSRYKRDFNHKDILIQVSKLGNENLIKLVDSIELESQNYDELLKKYKAKHPSLQRVKRSIDLKRETLYKSLGKMLKDNQLEKEKLKRLVKKYKRLLDGIPTKEIGYAKLKRDYDLSEKNYLLLLDKKRELDILKKVQGGYSYRVLDSAILPKVHSKPKSIFIVAISIFLGLISGIFYALIREYFAKKIRVASEVEELTRLPYLGTIPYIKSKRLYNDLFVDKDPSSIASEMMWSLRDRVDSFKGKKGSKVIALTSMVKGEGKTTIASNLALCLGMGDKRAIVLSLDLRLPEIHTRFKIGNKVGLTSVLFGKKRVSEVIFRSREYKNLFIIPSGPPVSNPMQIINSNYIDGMIEELREFFDYIVIDLPPAGVSAESLFLMKKADLVISVLKANYSEKSFVTYMESISKKSGIKNLGFVLNSVNSRYIKIISRGENRRYIKRNREYTKYLSQKSGAYKQKDGKEV